MLTHQSMLPLFCFSSIDMYIINIVVMSSSIFTIIFIVDYYIFVMALLQLS